MSVVRPRLADLRVQLDEVRRERARLDAVEASIVRDMDAIMRDPDHPDFVVADAELVRSAGLSHRDAKRVIARAATLDVIPGFDSALATGAVTAGHVDALAAGLAKLSPADQVRLVDRGHNLLANAQRLSVDEFAKTVRVEVARAQSDGGLSRFERQRRSTYLKVWNDADGMIHLRGAFDPERGTALAARLDARVEALFHSGDTATPVEVMPGVEPNDHRRALALIDMSKGVADINGSRPARAEIIVHVDLETLRSGLHESGLPTTQHGVELPVETLRRLACDADIIPVVLNGHSVPLDVGKAKRLATVHQRRALAAVHPTCAFPNCTVKFAHCEPHHLTPWEHGGPTDLHNLVPLCSQHHHTVHEGGQHITLDPTTRLVTIEVTRNCAFDT